jgi:type I restriction enzyme S subunit
LNLKFPHLPLPEQRRIAALLDQADALRAKRREALAQLDSLAQSVFIEMFGDPALNDRGWPTTRLSELIVIGDTINYGVVQPGDDVEDGVPLVRVGDLTDGKVSHAALKQIDPMIEGAYKRSRLKGDEILVSCVGTIGAVALVTEAEKGFNIARAVARIRLSDVANKLFIAAQLGTTSVQRYFTQELRTVSQPTLNIKQLSETKLITPPKLLQDDFAARVTALETIKSASHNASNELDNLFASLQHRAFQGEL